MIRFEEEIAEGCFEQKLIGEEELEVVVVSHWLPAGAVAGLGEVFLLFLKAEGEIAM